MKKLLLGSFLTGLLCLALRAESPYCPNDAGVNETAISGRNNSDTALTVDALAPDMTVYPSPFQSTIRISHLTGSETCELLSIIGEVIYKGKDIASQDFSALTRGIYFVKVSNRQGKKLFKIFKE